MVGDTGLSGDEKSPGAEVLKAVDAKAHVLEGLYDVVITLACSVRVPILPGIMDIREMTADRIDGLPDCLRG